MPVTQFFRMLDESLKIRANHYAELCDIQAISICGARYHDEIRQKYKDIASGDKEIIPPPPPDPLHPVFKSDSEDARASMFNMISIIKRTT